MGCGASTALAPEALTNESEWKLWNQLDLRDEHERVHLAFFLNKVYDLAVEEGVVQEDTQKESWHHEDNRHAEHGHDDIAGTLLSSVQIEVEYAGLHLPPQLTEESVLDLLSSLEREEVVPLHKKYVMQIMGSAVQIFREAPNVTRVPKPSKGQQVIVVGDLHGHLRDLTRILRTNGLPSKDTRYIFNGDFTDRGEFGVETLFLIMALKVVYPNFIHVNRGNHEDIDINRMYGFYDEVLLKYKEPGRGQGQLRRADELFGKITAVYKYLPLCSIIEGTAFVVHGGMLRSAKWTLEDIEDCPRSMIYTTMSDMFKSRGKALPSVGKGLSIKCYSELVEDLVWSDPDPRASHGTDRRPNTARKSGTIYGLEVARTWLADLRLCHFVRSHECVKKGHEASKLGGGKWFHTIFSASNYSGGSNRGAVLVFAPEGPLGVVQVSNQSWACDQPGLSIKDANRQSLAELFCAHKHTLLALFEATAQHGSRRPSISDGAALAEPTQEIPEAPAQVSTKKAKTRRRSSLGGNSTKAPSSRPKTSLVSPSQWASVMKKELGDTLNWAELQPLLAPDKNGQIDYLHFLAQFKVGLQREGTHEHLEHDLVHALYHNHKRLQQVFRLFDKDHNGVVDKDEFLEKCNWINAHIPEEQHIDGDVLFRIMDLDASDSINLNELFEAFRISQSDEAAAQCGSDAVMKSWKPLKSRVRLVMMTGARGNNPVSLQAEPRH